MPEPDWGNLGLRTPRAEGAPQSLASLLWYNADGTGQDGNQLPAFLDGVLKRACATGYRWVFTEMPNRTALATLRAARRDGFGALAAFDRGASVLRVTQQDQLDGFRPYFVEYSPLHCTRRRIARGVLDYMVLRVPLDPAQEVTDTGLPVPATYGRYLLVRAGYRGLGAMWQEGGWWLYTNDHEEIDHGTWESTRGLIPMVRCVGEQSPGTWEHPALARSLTMELGQIAVDLMNARSEQRHNARQAAKTILWGLGMDGTAQSAAGTQVTAGSLLVGVPPVQNPDGSYLIPQIWSSSSALMDTQVYGQIIADGLSEARELMVRQVTSTPDSSGESKKAGFEEGTSPMLARMAANFETWVNSLLYFWGQRAGIPTPTASITMPR
ncbi:MAG TPA: hypothetical protein VLD58_02700, partial [Gemmatimonadales bacterium]|nr:hypothetical protein [Gemmatimonadales bacterium]